MVGIFCENQNSSSHIRRIQDFFIIYIVKVKELKIDPHDTKAFKKMRFFAKWILNLNHASMGSVRDSMP